jgi:hypothetical protein
LFVCFVCLLLLLLFLARCINLHFRQPLRHAVQYNSTIQ